MSDARVKKRGKSGCGGRKTHMRAWKGLIPAPRTGSGEITLNRSASSETFFEYSHVLLLSNDCNPHSSKPTEQADTKE